MARLDLFLSLDYKMEYFVYLDWQEDLLMSLDLKIKDGQWVKDLELQE